jgi:hypothetical protein
MMDLDTLRKGAMHALSDLNDALKIMGDFEQFRKRTTLEIMKDKIHSRLILDLGIEVDLFEIECLDWHDHKHNVMRRPTRVQLKQPDHAPIHVFYHSLALNQKPSVTVPIYGIRIFPERTIVSNLGKFHLAATLGQAVLFAEIEGRKLALGQYIEDVRTPGVIQSIQQISNNVQIDLDSEYLD